MKSVANFTCVSTSSVIKWEDSTSLPDMTRLQILIKIYNLDPEEILKKYKEAVQFRKNIASNRRSLKKSRKNITEFETSSGYIENTDDIFRMNKPGMRSLGKS